MANDIDYSDWMDGEPVLLPLSDGSLDDWVDGEPITLRLMFTATLIVVGAYHVLTSDDSFQPETALHVNEPYHEIVSDNVRLGSELVENFGEYTIGSTPTPNWNDDLWASFYDGYTIESYGSYGNGKSLYLHDASNDAIARWDAIGQMGDCEILAKCEYGVYNDGPCYIWARASGSAGSEYGYFAKWNNASGVLSVGKFVNGTKSTITYTALTQNDNWHWIRFRVVGTSLKAKYWNPGYDEPASWQIDTTDSDVTSQGYVGFGTFNYYPYCDWFGVHTDGSQSVTFPPTELVVADCYHINDAVNVGLNFGFLSTDFSEYTTGQALSDWTEQWNTSSVSNIVQSGSWEWIIGKELLIDNNITQRWALSWDALNTTDIDIIALVSCSYANQSVRLVARGSGSAGSENGYFIQHNGGSFFITKYVAGIATNLTSVAVEFFANNYYFFRFRVVGTSLKAKIWPYLNAEPYDWTLETTDSDLSSGWCGLGGYYGYDAYCYYFNASINPASIDAEFPHLGCLRCFGPMVPMATGSASTINYTRLMGGMPPSDGTYKIKGAQLWPTTHTSQVRMAIYSGGSLSSGPDGATLLVDLGMTSGSDTSAYVSLLCTPIEMPAATPIWLAIKGDDSGVLIPYSDGPADGVNWQQATGRYDSSAVSTDESVAFPSTWPTDSGSFAAYWYLVRLLVNDAERLLTVVGASHDSVSDNLTLTTDAGTTSLVVAEAYSEHVADTADLAMPGELSIQPVDHLHFADTADLTQTYALTVAECYHIHAPPNIDLEQFTGLSIQDCYHELTSPNITVNSNVSLHNLDSANILADDFTFLISPDTTVTLFDFGAAGYSSSGYSAGNIRVSCDTSKAFQNHNRIRFELAAPTTSGTLDVVKMAFAARDSGDIYSETATIVTFDDSQAVSIPSASSVWSDWILFDPPAGGQILASFKFNATYYPSKYTTSQITYRNATTVDYTEILNFPTSWSSSGTWVIRSIQVMEAPLEIASAYHENLAGNIDFAQHFLTTQDSAHELYSEQGLATPLVLSDADHLHIADNVGFVINLTIEPANHLLESNNIDVSIEHYLSVYDGQTDHFADTLVLTQQHTLAIEECASIHAVDSFRFVSIQHIAMASASHVHTIEPAGAYPTLSVNSCDNLLESADIILSMGSDLIVAGSDHVHTIDGIGVQLTLNVQTGDIFHGIDTLHLSGVNQLAVLDLYHLLAIQKPDIYMTGDLPINSGYLDLVSEEPVFGGTWNLMTRNAYNRLFVDAISFLDQQHLIDMDQSHIAHVHAVDDILFAALLAELNNLLIESATALRTVQSESAHYTIEACTVCERTIHSS